MVAFFICLFGFLNFYLIVLFFLCVCVCVHYECDWKVCRILVHLVTVVCMVFVYDYKYGQPPKHFLFHEINRAELTITVLDD